MARIPAIISAQGQSATAQARSAPVRTAMARQHTGDRLTQNAQDEADKGTRGGRACPLVDGNLIQNVAVTVSGTPVAHRLGRKWTGYVVTKRNGSGSVYHVAQAASLDALQIVLAAASPLTVDVWVF